MLHRWRNEQKQKRFYSLTHGIFDTPPVRIASAPWSIISIVSNNYVQMYLLSLKSFYRQLGRGNVIAIIDRDMTAASRALLEQHIPSIQFVSLEDIDTGICQRGGTWERLVYLLDRSEKEYVIQLDCDTLTFGHDVNEVVHCATSNIAFTLSNAGRPIEAMTAIVRNAELMDSNYVGIIAERFFNRYPRVENLRYVRASSGFAGFAKGGFHRRDIEKFHKNMENLLGSRWKEWGTEQCGSNFAVANSPNAVVLPYPKYANFWPNLVRGHSSFLHFIGSHRYLDDYYASLAKEVIHSLQKQRSDSKKLTSSLI